MMNQEDVFKKIGSILSELRDQYEFLAQNPKQLNELELELFLANANFLTDHVQILQKINNSRPVRSIPEHTEINPEEPEAFPAVPETMPPVQIKAEESNEFIKPALQDDIFKPDNQPSSFEFILDDKPSPGKFDFEEKSVKDIFDRPLSEEEQRIIAQKQKLQEQRQENSSEEEELSDEESFGKAAGQEEDEIGPEPFLVPPATEPLPVAEEPVVTKEPLEEAAYAPEVPQVKLDPPLAVPDAKPTLNERLASSLGVDQPSTTERPKTAITDLKQAITLNNKLLYIKDLFNGYNLAYSEAIDLLQKMPDFKTADAFLQKNYAVKNNWGAKQDTVDQFYEVLHQRFPVK